MYFLRLVWTDELLCIFRFIVGFCVTLDKTSNLGLLFWIIVAGVNKGNRVIFSSLVFKRYSDSVKDIFENFSIIINIVFWLRELFQLFALNFEVAGEGRALFHQKLNSVETFGLNLEGVVDLDFAEQKGADNGCFHAFRLLEKLVE